MEKLKHHIIFYNYYSKLNDILEEKIQKVRFSNLALLYKDRIKKGTKGKSMSIVEYKLRLRKLEIEEEMEYHEEKFISKFESENKDAYREYSDKDIYDYVLLYKEKVSSKIYNHKQINN